MMRKLLTGLLLGLCVSTAHAFQIINYVEQELPDKSNAANVSVDSITLNSGGIRFPDKSYQATAASGGGSGQGITWPSTFTLTTAYPFGVYATTLTATNTASFPAGYTASSGTVGGATFLPNGNTVLSGALNLPLAVNQCLQTNSLGNITTSGGVCGGSGGGSGGSVAFTFNTVVVTSPTSNVVVDTNTMSYVAWPNGVSSGTLAVNQNLNISTLTLSGTGAAAFKMTEGAAAGVSNVASGLDVCWADSTNHALTCDFNNSGSSGTVALSSTTVTAGHCTNWTAAGLLGDSGAACGSGSGGGGGTALGVGTGTASGYTSVIVSSPTSVILFNNANAQFTSTLQGAATNLINLGANVPLLNANQTFSGTNTLTNSTLFTGSVTVSNVSSFTFTNVSSMVFVNSTVIFTSSPVQMSTLTLTGFATSAGKTVNIQMSPGGFNGSWVYTVPDYGANSNFVMDTGNPSTLSLLGQGYQMANLYSTGYLGMGSLTMSQLKTKAVGVAGLEYYCSDCTSTPIVVSTGSAAGAWAESYSPTTLPFSPYEFAVSSTSTFYHVVISTNGHLISNGTSPTVSSCGTGSPSVVGTDSAGTITVGGGSVTACTLTFAVPYGLGCTVICVVSDSITTTTPDVVATNTGITFGFSATIGGGNINYVCEGVGSACR